MDFKAGLGFLLLLKKPKQAPGTEIYLQEHIGTIFVKIMVMLNALNCTVRPGEVRYDVELGYQKVTAVGFRNTIILLYPPHSKVLHGR